MAPWPAWRLAVLLFTAEVRHLWAAQPFQEAALATCSPRGAIPPCEGCTLADRTQVLKKCRVWFTRFVQFTPSRNDESAVLSIKGDSWRVIPGRFGNQLAGWFTAIGIAKLGGFYAKIRPLVYEDIRIEFPPPRFDMERRFARLPELEHLCLRCTLGDTYYHECSGIWTAAGVREYLQHALPRFPPTSPYFRSIVIQFRCKGVKAMGFPQFKFYELALRPHLTPDSVISILPDGEKYPCCRVNLLMLQEALQHTFGCTVEMLRTTPSVRNDFQMLMSADVLVAGPSTFGLFAAIATYGKAYLPVAEVLMNLDTPCFDDVQWIRSPREAHGCRRSIVSWFVPPGGELHSHLSNITFGVWFNKSQPTPSFTNGTDW